MHNLHSRVIFFSQDKDALCQETQVSLGAVVRAYLLSGRRKYAEKFCAEHNMSERHFFWLQARALARNHDWKGLESLACDRRFPYDNLSLVELCQRFGAPKSELAKHIARVQNGSRRAELFTEAGLDDGSQFDSDKSHSTFASKAVEFFSI